MPFQKHDWGEKIHIIPEEVLPTDKEDWKEKEKYLFLLFVQA